MIRTSLSTTSVLDESADAFRVAAPWAAVLIATAMPYLFALAIFVDDLLELGANANRYGTALRARALWIVLAFILACWGRAVFARAVRLADASGVTPGHQAWRVSPAAFVSYLFTASFAEVLRLATGMTVVAVPIVAMFSGLAIGTMELNERPSIRGAFRLIARHGREGGILAAITLIFICALVVAFVNIGFFLFAGLWLSSSVIPFDAARWYLLLGLGNRRTVLLLIAGALLAIEPFWIAANVILVRRAGAAESGDDLRVWFEELRRA